ncbi:hypothetical protein FHP25_04955 [Vineibacter terrae]|uniref:Uncharacterized protein n=1 Tax=Vineibacter terrae TaxID=2586908 RepID=A0A5C8PTR1_9HYPH|nr:hypothetical protein [Vineibacter terrae]TXL80383.1 hypothetical protein FHP25_04955 [Vineibacter terrae]
MVFRMQRFRKWLTATLVVAMAWTAAFQPAAAYAPLPLASAVTAPCDDACEDCKKENQSSNDCGAPAACAAACVRLPAQPPANLEAPLAHLVVPVDVADPPAYTAGFASRVIRPLLPPPRG